MRFVTYNLLDGGVDAGGRDRRAAQIAILRNLSPDVLVLNECNGFERDGGALFEHYARALGMQGELARADSGYHVALMSRAARMLTCRVLRADFHHVAIHATLEVTGRELSLLAAHLDPFSAEHRLREARALVGERGRSGTVLMGDLNALSRRDLPGLDTSGWPARYLERHAVQAGVPDTRATDALEATGLIDLVAASGERAPTRPTQLDTRDVPLQRLDYIFATSELAAGLTRAAAVDTPQTQLASDHLPVVAELALA